MGTPSTSCDCLCAQGTTLSSFLLAAMKDESICFILPSKPNPSTFLVTYPSASLGTVFYCMSPLLVTSTYFLPSVFKYDLVFLNFQKNLPRFHSTFRLPCIFHSQPHLSVSLYLSPLYCFPFSPQHTEVCYPPSPPDFLI